jgi:hypothetical protein
MMFLIIYAPSTLQLLNCNSYYVLTVEFAVRLMYTVLF